ncbi:MAG: hypothetical protein AB7S44_03380 [Spirochaetales bacterium]
MKKLLLLFSVLLIATFIATTPLTKVYADTIPSPSLSIAVVGIEGNYYVDLLVDEAVNTTSSDAVYSALNVSFIEYADALRAYRNASSNAYWILDNVIPVISGQNLTLTDAETTSFHYRPTTFRIVIIKENKDIIVTDYVTITQYSSLMTVNLSDNVSLMAGETTIYEFTGLVTENANTGTIILGFLYRLLLTLLVELLIAIFIFKFTKKQAIKIIVLINIATQIIANLLLFVLVGFIVNPIINFPYVFLGTELLVVGLEMVAYYFLIKDYDKKKLLLYALVANLVTALLSFIV